MSCVSDGAAFEALASLRGAGVDWRVEMRRDVTTLTITIAGLTVVESAPTLSAALDRCAEILGVSRAGLL